MTKDDIDATTTDEGEIVWRPSPDFARDSGMNRFREFCEKRVSRTFADRAALHAWALEEPAAFWDAVWDFSKIVGDKGARVIEPAATFRETRFFPDARLNFAENLLAKRGSDDAIVFRSEDKVERRLSWDELRALASRLQQALAESGIKPGDRVASLLPNMPETIAFMLATVSLGRDLVVGLAGFRAGCGRRPARPSRAEGPRHLRRLLVRGQEFLDGRKGHRDCWQASKCRDDRRGAARRR